MRTLLFTILLLPGMACGSTGQEWRFRVFLEDREIGTHIFRVEDQGGERRVESDARFTVKILLINAYSYQHHASERWISGCLATIDARTDDNGEQLAVHGARRSANFEIDANRQRMELQGCVWSFAYWNPRMLQQPRLLNAQTGELTDVRIEPLGEEILNVRGQPVVARRYALHAPKFRIDVWYDTDRNWVQLESKTESGRKLRYLIQ